MLQRILDEPGLGERVGATVARESAFQLQLETGIALMKLAVHSQEVTKSQPAVPLGIVGRENARRSELVETFDARGTMRCPFVTQVAKILLDIRLRNVGGQYDVGCRSRLFVCARIERQPPPVGCGYQHFSPEYVESQGFHKSIVTTA